MLNSECGELRLNQTVLSFYERISAADKTHRCSLCCQFSDTGFQILCSDKRWAVGDSIKRIAETQSSVSDSFKESDCESSTVKKQFSHQWEWSGFWSADHHVQHTHFFEHNSTCWLVHSHAEPGTLKADPVQLLILRWQLWQEILH